MMNIVNKDSLKYETQWKVGEPVPESLLKASSSFLNGRVVLDVSGDELKMLIKAMNTEHELRA